MTDVLTLTDAKAAIRTPASVTGNDDDLTDTYIPAVTGICESLAGPIISSSRTWTADGGRWAVMLPSAFNTVTTVTETGATLTPDVDYTLNPQAGLVYRGTIASPFVFLPGFQNIVITYIAGYAEDTADVLPAHRLAARIILAHLWQVDQQGYRPQSGAPSSDVVTTPAGFAVPRRAVELLRPTPNVAGFA